MPLAAAERPALPPPMLLPAPQDSNVEFHAQQADFDNRPNSIMVSRQAGRWLHRL